MSTATISVTVTDSGGATATATTTAVQGAIVKQIRPPFYVPRPAEIQSWPGVRRPSWPALLATSANFILGFSFKLTVGVAPGVIGRLAVAFGTPTAWQINTLSPGNASWFSIDGSGNLSVTAAGSTGLTAASYMLTVQATVGGKMLVGSGSIQVVPASSFLTLAQSFGTNLNEVWATTKENNSYNGYAFTAKRADNSAIFNIPFAGKYADPAQAANFAGTTAIVTTVYGQINGLNAVAMSGTGVIAFIDTDGYWSFSNANISQSYTFTNPVSNSPGLFVADNALLRPVNPHIFCLMRAPQPNGGGPPYQGFGLMIEYGGTGAFYNVGRYGWGVNVQSGNGVQLVQNATVPNIAGLSTAFGTYQFTIGVAHTDTWHVWDFSPSTLECRFDAGYSEILPAQASTSITYPVNTQLNIASDFDGNSPYLGNWRLLALYGATQASTTRNSISNFLMSDGTIVTPLATSFTDSSGFTYTPNYFPDGNGPRFGPDLYGLSWYDEYGGYQWPSFGSANNLSNSGSANLVRLEVRQGDSDCYISGAQRCERGAYGTTVSPGQNAAIFQQFYLEPGSALSNSGSNWAFIFQVHYGSTGTTPDICTLSIANETFQAVVDSGGTGGIYIGSTVPIVRSTWWALLYRITWSNSRTADSFQCYLGQNGGALTKIVDVSGALFSTVGTVNAYPKQGIYTGNPGFNPNCAMRVANHQFSNTLTAFDAYITSQPALPTHP